MHLTKLAATFIPSFEEEKSNKNLFPILNNGIRMPQLPSESIHT